MAPSSKPEPTGAVVTARPSYNLITTGLQYVCLAAQARQHDQSMTIYCALSVIKRFSGDEYLQQHMRLLLQITGRSSDAHASSPTGMQSNATQRYFQSLETYHI